MTHTNVIHKSLIFSQSLRISSRSSIYISKNCSHAHMLSQIDNIDRFEQIVEKLIRTLKKLNVKNKIEDVKLKT